MPKEKRNYLVYTKLKINSKTIKRHFKKYREEAGTPERCDNTDCKFHTEPLVWNGMELPLILDHINGVNSDNRPENLRFLCPNCNEQLATRGGKNKGRVQQDEGGFSIRRGDGSGLKDYTLPVENAEFRMKGHNANFSVPKSAPEGDAAGSVEKRSSRHRRDAEFRKK